MCGRFTGLTYDEVREVLRHLNDDDVSDQWDDWAADVDEDVAADADERAGGAVGAGAFGGNQPTGSHGVGATGSVAYASGDAGEGTPVPTATPDGRATGRTDVFPGMRATILAPEGGLLRAGLLTWGYSVPWQDGRVFNTRIESALGGGAMWRDSIANRRCIVPTLGFFEPHATERIRSFKTGKPIKRPYRFAIDDRMPTLLAGVWQRDEFSVLTTQPNGSVSPVHNRMPLVLRPSEVRTWLYGDFASLADRSDMELRVQPLGELYEPRQRVARAQDEPTGEDSAASGRGSRGRRPDDGQLSLF